MLIHVIKETDYLYIYEIIP